LNSLYIAATKSTPEIAFDPSLHRLSMKGESYPENAFKFYEPIFSWVEQYIHSLKDQQAVTVTLELPYINTSSTKCLMMLLEKFEEAYQAGKNIRLEWYCNEENDSELECAEEFQEDMSMPFDILMIKEA
jgi:hypothetical protein